jgi:MFS transporter, DHA1 family, multidrug resistance protein
LRALSQFSALCSVGFFARLSYALARSPVLPLFALSLGAGPEAIGFAVGISTVTGIFFKLPAGALSDIIGRRRTMLIGLLFFAFTPFAYLGVHSYEPLVLIRFLHGMATAVYGPVSMAVVADVARAKKGELLSWFSSVTIIGNLLGAPLGGLILHRAPGTAAPALADFHLAYLASGITGVMALLLFLTLLKDGQDRTRSGGLTETSRRFFAGIREVASDRRVVVTSIMEGMANLAVGALEAFLPIYAVKVAGLNELQAGLLWGGQVVTTVLSKPIMGRSSDRYGRRALIAAGLVVSAAAFGMIPRLTGFWPLLIAAAGFGFGEALVTSSGAALVAGLCKERHFGTAMGTFGTIFDVGHASGPILAGVLIARFSYGTSFLALAAILMLAVPLFLAVVRAEDAAGTSG